MPSTRTGAAGTNEPGHDGQQTSVDLCRLSAFGDGPGQFLLVTDSLELVQGLVESGAEPRRGCEAGRQMTHALNHADGFVMHRALRIAAIIGHAIQHSCEHRLEYGPSYVGSDAAMRADAKAEVAIAFSVQNYPIGLKENGWITVGHGPGNPEPLALFEAGTVDRNVLRERPPITGRGCVKAQKLLGGGIEEGIALAAEQFPLLRVLR